MLFLKYKSPKNVIRIANVEKFEQVGVFCNEKENG